MLTCRLAGDGDFYMFFGRAIFTYSAGKEASPFVSVASVPFGCTWSFDKCFERWLFPDSDRFGRQVRYVVGICRRYFRLGKEAGGSAVATVIVMGMMASEGWLESLFACFYVGWGLPRGIWSCFGWKIRVDLGFCRHWHSCCSRGWWWDWCLHPLFSYGGLRRSSDWLCRHPMISDRVGWWNVRWNRGRRGLGEDGFCCGLLKFFCNFMYALVRSDPYFSVGMGCVSLDCSSASMSLAVFLRYVLVEIFGKGIFLGNQLIVVVYMVEFVDVTKNL